MFKVNRVVGIASVHRMFKDLQKDIQDGAKEAIYERTNDLFDEVYFMASNEPQTGLVRNPEAKASHRMTGSGIEIGSEPTYKDIPQAVIGKREGNLQSALRKKFYSTKLVAFGEVGFNRSIRPNGETLDTLNWPGPVTRVRIPKTSVEQFPDKDHDESPTSYIPKVILGTERMYGRNIFRMALISDILYKKTMRIIIEKVQLRLAKYQPKDAVKAPF